MSIEDQCDFISVHRYNNYKRHLSRTDQECDSSAKYILQWNQGICFLNRAFRDPEIDINNKSTLLYFKKQRSV